MADANIAVVTGAAGFIGSHMVDLLLEQGYRVRALDNLCTGRLANLAHHGARSDLTFERLDLRDIAPGNSAFRGAKFVFHFAGIGDIVPSIERPVDYMSANVMGTVAALEASRHAGVKRFVYAASSSCYGLARTVPTDERAEVSVQYPYALSKYLGEQAVMHWANVYRLPVNSMRIFNAFGLRSRTNGAYGAVFGVFLAQKAAGKPFTVVGDGTQKRDFIFVTDVVRAFWLAATSQRANEIYNLGAGSPQSVNRLVELLKGPKVHLPHRPGEPDCTWADTSKIRSHLKWEPQVPFERGVAVMLDHLDCWRGAPVWEQDSIQGATDTWFRMLGR